MERHATASGKMITEKYPDIVDSLYDKGSYFWTSKTANLDYCTQIGVDKYLWTTMGNKSKLACLRYLFEKCDIAESELVMLLEPVKE